LDRAPLEVEEIYPAEAFLSHRADTRGARRTG
jgi:hypothetical protein